MDWHGWSKTASGYAPRGSPHKARTALHIGTMPDRKQKVLYRIKDGRGDPLAYFVSDDAALVALALIDWITGLTDEIEAE